MTATYLIETASDWLIDLATAAPLSVTANTNPQETQHIEAHGRNDNQEEEYRDVTYLK